MRKKLFTNIVAITSVIAITFALCSCGAKDNVPNPVGDETSSTTQEAESSTDGEDESTSQQTTTEKPTTEEPTTEESTTEPELPLSDIKNMTTDGFVPLSDVKENCTFEMTYGADNKEQDIYGSKTFTGEYQLVVGGKNNSIHVYDTGNYEAYIEIDGIKKEFSAVHIEDIVIIDMDKNDNYKEVAVLDAGPSGDPGIWLFRLIDGTVKHITGTDGWGYDYILFDRNGKMISGYAYITFFETEIVTQYVEVKDNVATWYRVDYTEMLNKKYTLAEDELVAFLETEDRTDYPDISDTITLKKGTEITLIEATPLDRLYYIELPDGRRGTITNQLAG